VVEKQPNRAAVWTFQETEAVDGSEVDNFNSKINGKVNALQQQGRKSINYVVKHIPFSTPHLWLYLPNAEMTPNLEANEVEVKVLTSLASVTEITGIVLPYSIASPSSKKLQHPLYESRYPSTRSKTFRTCLLAVFR
jgi:hypothetical protein